MKRPVLRRLLLSLGTLAALASAALAHGTRGGVAWAAHRRYEAPAQAAPLQTFDEVIARGTKVQFCTLETGRVYVPRSSMLRHDAAQSDAANEHAPFAIYAHLLRHPSRGDLLVDAGLDASFARDPYGNLRGPARLVHRAMGARFELSAGDDLASQLLRYGAAPRAVFFTHVHGDHTAGLPALGPGVRLVVGTDEHKDAAAYLGYGHLPQGAVVEDIDAAQGRRMEPFERVVDLLGDGSLLALATPGHSRGHTSYLVNAASGPVLLAGDACHSVWAFERGIGPVGPTADDERRGQASLDALRSFAAAHPAVRVVPGHEAPVRVCDL